jgi:hypothetical protein
MQPRPNPWLGFVLPNLERASDRLDLRPGAPPGEHRQKGS